MGFKRWVLRFTYVSSLGEKGMMKPGLRTDVHGIFNEMQAIYVQGPIYVLVREILLIKYEFLNEVVGWMSVVWFCYISTQTSFGNANIKVKDKWRM